MAESERGVLETQCLERRIPDWLKLIEEVAAWQANRNKHNVKRSVSTILRQPVLEFKLGFLRVEVAG
jgi:hypothetical protein